MPQAGGLINLHVETQNIIIDHKIPHANKKPLLIFSSLISLYVFAAKDDSGSPQDNKSIDSPLTLFKTPAFELSNVVSEHNISLSRIQTYVHGYARRRKRIRRWKMAMNFRRR